MLAKARALSGQESDCPFQRPAIMLQDLVLGFRFWVQGLGLWVWDLGLGMPVLGLILYSGTGQTAPGRI